MIVAKNNIVVKMDRNDPEEYAILNPISGSFDMMSRTEHEMYRELEHGNEIDAEMTEYLIERGYAFRDRQSHDRPWTTLIRNFRRKRRTPRSS